ncbi:MAG: 2Fe-2S iron-sulfur cluster binding domain-containing protein [Phaeodactylibacter sp.]|nr:2Fe-2S iron-sulfur cluster binding domain-containing protein [Phaeodactylibacter sp.]MCB9290338.1 2Fe-2S iron-sulfur cluster binding domain-containing protein [Lewinellaceae bacterium]
MVNNIHNYNPAGNTREFENEISSQGFMVEYNSLEKKILVEDNNTTLLQAAIRNRIPHMQECGGNGRCTTCRVKILEGLQNVAPRNEVENLMARRRGWDPAIRLACQTRIKGPVKVERQIKTFSEISRLQEEMIKSGKGEEKQLAIIFCDMRNFTPFVEGNMAYDVVHILNRFFSALGEPILMNNGLIYQYVGDEIVGVFGLEDSGHMQNCLAAMRAALGMKAALEVLNKDIQEEFGLRIEVGIGVHFGPVIVGKVGHPSHQQFGIIGDAANVASRVQSANKDLQTTILATDNFLCQLPKDTAKVGKAERVQLKGKRGATQLFELAGFRKEDDLFLVQKTTGALFSDEGAFANEFYARLFAEAPEARGMFKGNMERQGYLMGHMLKGAIYALSRPKNVTLGFRELGRRHLEYGVREEHYLLVRKALIDTLKVRLKEHYSPRIRLAWERMFDLAFKFMQEGASGKSRAGAAPKPTAGV